MLSALSKWVDFHFHPLVKHCPSYLQDWDDLVLALRKLGKLPDNAQLFTMVATSMYTNIDTKHGIEVLRLRFNKLNAEGKLPEKFPKDLILLLTKIIIRNNFFQFGDTEWIQLVGTTMGTPMACIYSILYYSWKEIR